MPLKGLTKKPNFCVEFFAIKRDFLDFIHCEKPIILISKVILPSKPHYI